MKKVLTAIMLMLMFFIGACSAGVASAEQTWPLKIWAQNENGSLGTCVVVDDDTGVNYVVVTAMTYSNAKTIAITPRLNADGSLYVN